MKLILALLPVFLFFNVQAEMRIGWPASSENFMNRGDTLSNVLFLSETMNLASYADKFELFLQNAITTGRAYLKVLSELMRTIDVSPNLKETVQMIQLDIQAVQGALDDIERNARLKNVMVKATAECVAPHRDAIAKIKDETYMNLVEVVNIQRDAILDMMAAGQSIQEQVRVLEDIITKIVRAVLNNDNQTIANLVQQNRQSIESNIKIIRKTYASAIDDYNVVTSKTVRKLAEALQKSQVKGREILEAVDKCMQPQGVTNSVE